MVDFLFLSLKPVLFLMLKNFVKKQMKAFIVSAIEWLVIHKDNDLDDMILAKVKSGMKTGVVRSNGWESANWFNTLTPFQIHIWFFVSWLQTITEKCELIWSPNEYQINKIIIPAMQGTTQQYIKSARKFNALVHL